MINAGVVDAFWIGIILGGLIAGAVVLLQEGLRAWRRSQRPPD